MRVCANPKQARGALPLKEKPSVGFEVFRVPGQICLSGDAAMNPVGSQGRRALLRRFYGPAFFIFQFR